MPNLSSVTQKWASGWNSPKLPGRVFANKKELEAAINDESYDPATGATDYQAALPGEVSPFKMLELTVKASRKMAQHVIGIHEARTMLKEIYIEALEVVKDHDYAKEVDKIISLVDEALGRLFRGNTALTKMRESAEQTPSSESSKSLPPWGNPVK